MGRVEANQQFLRGERPGPVDHPVQVRDKTFLAVLAAGPQLNFEAPALKAKVGGNRGITVVAMIGAAYPFLLGV